MLDSIKAVIKDAWSKLHTYKVQLLCSFLLPLITLTAILIVLRVTPFGDNTFFYEDMKRQYMEFYAYYRSIFLGDNDFLYSFSNGIGGNLIGFSAYYLTSPWLLLLLPVPLRALPAAITVLLTVKLSLCGMTAYVFLRDLYLRDNSLSGSGNIPPAILVFSTIWCFSSYMALNIFNTMWVDAYLLFPLVFFYTKRVFEKKENAAFRYILLLALMLFCNYYITYMTLIFLVFYGLLHAGSVRTFFRWCCLSIVGAMLPAFLLLPAFFELLWTHKNAVEQGIRIFIPNEDLTQIFSKFFSLSFDTSQIYDGGPQLYCSLFILVLFVLYFVTRSIPAAERIKTAVLAAILIFSMCISKIDLVWHAFTEPEGYRYRYSFLLIFLAVACGWRVWMNTYAHAEDNPAGTREENYPAQKSTFAAEDARASEQKNPGHTYLRELLIAALIIGFCFAWIPHRYLPYLDASKKAYNFALLLVTIALLLAVFLYKEGKIRRKVGTLAATALLMVTAADLCLNFCLVYRETGMFQLTEPEYQTAVSADGTLIEEIKQMDTGFYRIENEDPLFENDAMLYNYNGVTGYTSVTENIERDFLSDIGFNDNELFVEYDPGNTTLVDRLLGIRYLLHDGTYTRYDATIPMAYGDERNVGEIIAADDHGGDPFTRTQSILSAYADKDAKVLFPAEIVSAEEEKESRGSNEGTGMEGKSAIDFCLRTTCSGNLYFYAVGKKQEEDMLFTVNGTEMKEYFGNMDCTKVMNLGYFEKGETVNVHIGNIAQMIAPENFLFVTEDEDAVDEVCSAIQKNADDIRKISSSHLLVTTRKGQNSLVLAVPYNHEWKVTVDGRPSTVQTVYNIYMGINLDGSKAHTVELQYRPDGFTGGIIISILTLCGLIAVNLRNRMSGSSAKRRK